LVFPPVANWTMSAQARVTTLRRFLIFVLAGPPIGLAVLFLVLIPGASIDAGQEPASLVGLGMLLAVFMLPGWAAGAGPALVVWALDAGLAWFGMPFRWVLCALLGYGLSTILTFFLATEMFGPPQWTMGLIGAVPGALCSWWAGYADNGTIRSRVL